MYDLWDTDFIGRLSVEEIIRVKFLLDVVRASEENEALQEALEHVKMIYFIGKRDV
jgi:hypothetical protein